MKINRSTLFTFFIILVFTSFYSCKKNDGQIDSSSAIKYSHLPADISEVARWYDKQMIDHNSRNLTGKNTIDWSKVIKSTMPNGSTVYALQISSAKNVMNELDINKSKNNEFYAVVKAYTRDNQTGLITMNLSDINGNFITEGILKDGKYLPIKGRNSAIKSFSDDGNGETEDIDHGDDGIDIGVDGSGKTIVNIDAPAPQPQDPVFTLPDFPSGPDFPSFPTDPGFPVPVGSGGNSDSNISIIVNNIKNPCLKSLVDNILNHNFKDKMSGIISNLAGNTKIQITFNDAPSTSDNSPANSHDIFFTQATGVFTENVTLSTDKLAESSKEYATTVIIHEIIHNYFSFNSGAQSIPNSHQLMADGFVTPMASYLTSLYPNMSIQDATALVWIGISDSNSYIGSSNFDYPGGTMTKDDIKGIYSTYVAVVKGTPICN